MCHNRKSSYPEKTTKKCVVKLLSSTRARYAFFEGFLLPSFFCVTSARYLISSIHLSWYLRADLLNNDSLTEILTKTTWIEQKNYHLSHHIQRLIKLTFAISLPPQLADRQWVISFIKSPRWARDHHRWVIVKSMTSHDFTRAASQVSQKVKSLARRSPKCVWVLRVQQSRSHQRESEEWRKKRRKKTLFNLCFDSEANGRVQKDHKKLTSPQCEKENDEKKVKIKNGDV